MKRVFTKFFGSRVNAADHTIGLALADSLGAVEEIALVSDIAEEVAHALVATRAAILKIEEGGVPVTGPAGELLRSEVLRADAVELRRVPEPDGRPVLVIQTPSGAEYSFVFPHAYEERVRSLASPSHPGS